jgi:hypothetical protein
VRVCVARLHLVAMHERNDAADLAAVGPHTTRYSSCAVSP